MTVLSENYELPVGAVLVVGHYNVADKLRILIIESSIGQVNLVVTAGTDIVVFDQGFLGTGFQVLSTVIMDVTEPHNQSILVVDIMAVLIACPRPTVVAYFVGFQQKLSGMFTGKDTITAELYQAVPDYATVAVGNINRTGVRFGLTPGGERF